MAAEVWVLPLAECRENRLVGGKALNLGRLMAARFPVPDGFAITTDAYRHARTRGGAIPDDLAQAILRAYHALGSPTVAVRSSATAEDMAEASMAGQYETFLNVRGDAAVLEAVGKAWASLDSPRTRSYLAEHGIDLAQVAMAVVVQRLVAADVAGVLFTANPQTGRRSEMLIEASWGLGEAVVSGVVQPDTLVIDAAHGSVQRVTIADKQLWVPPEAHGEEPRPLPDEKRRQPCLSAQDVLQLWDLGRRVMEYFGAPQDLEWAIAQGRLYLLQSRAITTLEEAEALEECLQQTRTALAEARRQGRGPWVRHNLGETLPQPTPLTWSVIRRFMSGDGGFGAMYRMVGFAPSAAARQDGVLDLIAGRVYLDLSRAGQMFFEDLPFKYDLALVRANPDAAQGPPTVPAGGMLALYRVGRRLARINAGLAELARDGDRRLERDVFPAFVAWVRQEKQRDLRALSVPQWLDLWKQRERRTLDELAAQAFLPSLIGAMALADLRQLLDEHFWDADPDALVNELTACPRPDLTVQGNQALHDVAHGRMSLEQWLERYGHRAPEEFDLAAPRWREKPEALRQMAQRLQGAAAPAALHEKRLQQALDRARDLERRLPRSQRAEFRRRLDLAQRYLPFREDGKFHVVLGCDLLRDLALEAGSRLEIGQDVFLLSLDELRDALLTGYAPLHLIAPRRRRRAAEARLTLPNLITDAEIGSLGEPPRLTGQGQLPAFPISPGACTGPARIVHAPDQAGDLGQGYVLVCPSTDPNWTPLFVNAAGLVLERGGTLSHGAVVAREMGIPGVVLDNATRILQEGETVSLDGHHGAVLRVSAAAPPPAAAAEPPVDPHDLRVPRGLTPPPPGPVERRSGTLRNVLAGVWLVYLLLVWLLPGSWLYDPTTAAYDRLLWPVVRALGKPWTVVIVGAVMGVGLMLLQRLLTDHHRLVVAKKRADALKREAAKLPEDAPRRRLLLQLAAPVQNRIVAAAFVPLAAVLGPMVMVFPWLMDRVDPASANARPGAQVFVKALVDGEYTQPITLAPDPALTLDATTAPAQALPPIRATLEDLLAEWQGADPVPGAWPWDVQAAAISARQRLLASLKAYLARPIPPQVLTWALASPPDRPGRFLVRLATPDAAQPPLVVPLILGDVFPPQPREDLGDKQGPTQVLRPQGSPIQRVQVVYKDPPTYEPSVFAPAIFRRLPDWIAMWGWLITYLAVYIPLMFLTKWVLGVP